MRYKNESDVIRELVAGSNLAQPRAAVGLLLKGSDFKSLANIESLFKMMGGMFLVYAATNITIPIQPVPITLQTFAILLMALLYSRAESFSSIVGYVTVGLMGAPVFSGGKFGLMTLLSPTGGYIMGFVAAVFVVGYLKEKLLAHQAISPSKTFLYAALIALLGLVIIFAMGMLWLTYLFNIGQAWAVGVMPFILPEIIKAGCLGLALSAVGFFKKR